jgi:hypothetical protein
MPILVSVIAASIWGFPYATHLENVALVESVSDKPETIAAARLHDVVEDTPATVESIEEAFGKSVASLVESLTDVSRPDFGNRAVRKEIDRQHLARASSRAKTVKLADLIDNCQDIGRNDTRFAKLYLKEMGRLLEVLQEGNADLYREAVRIHDECSRRLGVLATQEDAPASPPSGPWSSVIIPEHVIRTMPNLSPRWTSLIPYAPSMWTKVVPTCAGSWRRMLWRSSVSGTTG